MPGFLWPLLLLACEPLAASDGVQGSYICRAAFSLDCQFRGPTQVYVPQPGDIFLATDQAIWAKIGHWIAGAAGVHHSGIVFARSHGDLGLLEAGPFNSLKVEILDPIDHMRDHVRVGDHVWIRQRRIPLTPEQSARLTMFAEAQEGKPFAVWRLLGQVTPFRSRGPIRTWFLGPPHGDRSSYFCSELVMECCAAAKLLDPSTLRPAATYPRDLFYDWSFNWYLNGHLHLETGWYPPALWSPDGQVSADGSGLRKSD
jgi:hypothetical protein